MAAAVEVRSSRRFGWDTGNLHVLHPGKQPSRKIVLKKAIRPFQAQPGRGPAEYAMPILLGKAAHASHLGAARRTVEGGNLMRRLNHRRNRKPKEK
jgi:hypothetical protein